MEEKKPAEPSAPLEEEEELEFRPWVKWTAVGVAGAVSIGLFLLVHEIGYAQGEEAGFQSAICSGVVHESLNNAASQNVLSFMQLASASNASLQSAAADTDKAFAWIKDTQIRREAEWCLVQALLERRLCKPAEPLLEKLFEAVPRTAEWAFRSLQVADQLAAAQQYQQAAAYYKRAAAGFAENQLQAPRLQALEQLVALVTSSSHGGSTASKNLQGMIKLVQDAGAGAQYLLGILHAYGGELSRCKGDVAGASSQYQAVLKLAPSVKTDNPVWAAALGLAMLENGDAAGAEPLLRQAERNTGNRPSDISARLLALRQLAVIEQQRGHHVTAMALLHRAQGVAEGRVQPKNAFWPCLFDQRGWMHFVVQNYQTALIDFNNAISSTQVPQLLMQPQEGAARCYMELGKPEQALPLLRKCLELRVKYAPADKQSLGRINLLLGQMYDQQGKIAEAGAAYSQAVQNLQGDKPDVVENRRAALLGLAYCQTQNKQWKEAYATWEQVIPLLGEQYDRLEEVRAQMRRIKPFITAGEAEHPAP